VHFRKQHMIGSIRVRRRKSQAGFTLIEVMIAGAVLVFGLLALTALFATAIGNNGRSRVDSTATMLAESVIEQITAVLANGGPASVTDCAATPNTWPVESSVGGARLSGAAIDFTETSPPDGYHMSFVVCNGGGEAPSQAIYDVRWNVSLVSQTYLVTVSARPQNMAPNRFTFSLPVTLRAYVGPE
jgi:Tfp pilus assembly protein PilV